MAEIGRSTKFRPEKKASTEKKPGVIRKFLDKLRPRTFSEQFGAAAGKKEFTSKLAKDKGGGWFSKPKGKLHYATTKKADVEKKIAKSKAAALKAKEGKGGGADSGSKKKPVYEKATGTKVSKKGQAFAAARKAGKKEFTFEGKKYHTRLKGEKPKKIWPELSDATAREIRKVVRGKKKFVGGRKRKQGGGRIADAARRAQIFGQYSPDMGMRGRGPGMPGPNVMGGRDPRRGMRDPGMGGRGGFAKGGLIKGKPKLAVKGW